MYGVWSRQRTCWGEKIITLTHACNGKLFHYQLACYKTSEKSWHLSQPKQPSWVKYANRNLFINGSSKGFLKRTWNLSILPCTCNIWDDHKVAIDFTVKADCSWLSASSSWNSLRDNPSAMFCVHNWHSRDTIANPSFIAVALSPINLHPCKACWARLSQKGLHSALAIAGAYCVGCHGLLAYRVTCNVCSLNRVATSQSAKIYSEWALIVSNRKVVYYTFWLSWVWLPKLITHSHHMFVCSAADLLMDNKKLTQSVPSSTGEG